MLWSILPHFLLQNCFSYFPPLKPRCVLWSGASYSLKNMVHLYTPKIISAFWRHPWGWCGPQWKWVWHPYSRGSVIRTHEFVWRISNMLGILYHSTEEMKEIEKCHLFSLVLTTEKKSLFFFISLCVRGCQVGSLWM